MELQLTDNEVNAQGKRVLVMPNTTVVDTSLGCNPSNGIPSTIETVVLIQKGKHKINQKIQMC